MKSNLASTKRSAGASLSGLMLKIACMRPTQPQSTKRSNNGQRISHYKRDSMSYLLQTQKSLWPIPQLGFVCFSEWEQTTAILSDAYMPRGKSSRSQLMNAEFAGTR